MNKIIVIISCLFTALFSKAQINYTPQTAAGYQFKYVKVDSGFAIPYLDTTIGRGIVRAGAIVCKPSDKKLYVYNGTKWVDVSTGGGAGPTNKVDSVTIIGNVLFYWINGVSAGVTLPVGYSQDFQQVTDNGNVTTNDISANHIYANASISATQLFSTDHLIRTNTSNVYGDSLRGYITGDSIRTSNLRWNLPDTSGTFVLSVNGTKPNKNGNVSFLTTTPGTDSTINAGFGLTKNVAGPNINLKVDTGVNKIATKYDLTLKQDFLQNGNGTIVNTNKIDLGGNLTQNTVTNFQDYYKLDSSRTNPTTGFKVTNYLANVPNSSSMFDSHILESNNNGEEYLKYGIYNDGNNAFMISGHEADTGSYVESFFYPAQTIIHNQTFFGNSYATIQNVGYGEQNFIVHKNGSENVFFNTPDSLRGVYNSTDYFSFNGKNKTYRFNHLKNNVAEDSVLTTDNTGKLKLKLASTASVVGTGTPNEITYWATPTTLGSLSTSTYPSLTELSYVKGLTSSAQTQIASKLSNITGLISAGSNVSLTGSGTSGSPYVINSTGGSSSLTVGTTPITSGTSGRLLYQGTTGLLSQTANLVYDTTTFQFKVVGNMRLNQSATVNNILIGGGNLTATGTNNVGVGVSSLSSLTSGVNNFAGGFEALKNVADGSNNMALGTQALGSIVDGVFNVGIGTQAAFNQTNAPNNIAIGRMALFNNVSGNGNAAIGTFALQNTTGNFNTAFGLYSGQNLTSGGYNVAIGSWLDFPSATDNGQLNIGNVLYATGMYSTAASSATPVSGGKIGIGITSPTEKLDVAGSIKLSDYAIQPSATYTSGSTYTITKGETLFNPASVVSALTVTLPSSPVDGQLIYLNFGGTISAGAAVVTTLSFTGGTTYGSLPTTVNGGDNICLKYISSTNQWQRRIL